jgi:hypothetical protein
MTVRAGLAGRDGQRIAAGIPVAEDHRGEQFLLAQRLGKVGGVDPLAA